MLTAQLITCFITLTTILLKRVWVTRYVPTTQRVVCVREFKTQGG